MNSADIITVQDLDHMAKRYRVCDSDGREIGEKAGEAEYRKPVYDKYGRRRSINGTVLRAETTRASRLGLRPRFKGLRQVRAF